MSRLEVEENNSCKKMQEKEMPNDNKSQDVYYNILVSVFSRTLTRISSLDHYL